MSMSRTMALTILAVSILTVGVSQLILKSRLSHLASSPQPDATVFATVLRLLHDPLVWCAIALVLVSVVSWYVAMILLPLSLMLPVAGMIAPIVSISAHFVLGESLGATKLAAIAMISCGVIWLTTQSEG